MGVWANKKGGRLWVYGGTQYRSQSPLKSASILHDNNKLIIIIMGLESVSASEDVIEDLNVKGT